MIGEIEAGDDAFLTNPLLRVVIGQARSSFDFREAMDKRKIILCDLSKGEIGGDNTMLLGSVIITLLFQYGSNCNDQPLNSVERLDGTAKNPSSLRRWTDTI